MLIIVLSTGKEHNWHSGVQNPITFHEVSNVIEVQADGDELTFLLRHTENLPITKQLGRYLSQRWFGDHAKFIVANCLNEI